MSTLWPGGKERMRRLMSVVGSGAIDLRPIVTYRLKLDQIEEASDLFARQRDGALKVAIHALIIAHTLEPSQVATTSSTGNPVQPRDLT